MKVLQCPHLASFSGMTYYCLKGKFPINCEACDCKDKYFVEITTTTSCESIEDAINNPTYMGEMPFIDYDENNDDYHVLFV